MTDPSPIPAEAWSRALGTGFHGWRVLDKTTLALDLPPHCACNLSGAVQIAQAILPSVRTIQTFAGGVESTRYEKAAGRGQRWHALPAFVARSQSAGRPAEPPGPADARTSPLRKP